MSKQDIVISITTKRGLTIETKATDIINLPPKDKISSIGVTQRDKKEAVVREMYMDFNT